MTTTSYNKDTLSHRQLTMPVFYRLMIPLSLTILLLVGGFSTALLITQRQGTKQYTRHIINDVTRSLEMSLAKKAKVLNALEDVLCDNTLLREVLQTQDRERLLTLYNPIFQKLKDKYSITHFYFHLPNRVNLLRVHKPEKHGDFIDRFTAREAERSGKTASGIELGPLGTFTLRVVQPIHVGDTLIGYLELGQEIEGILQSIHKRLGIDLAVIIYKGAIERQKWESGMKMLGRESDWNRYEREVLTYYSQPHFPSEYDPFIHTKSQEPANVILNLQFDNRSWSVFGHPIRDVSNAEVGKLIIFNDVTNTEATFSQLLIITASMALLLLSGLFALLYVLLRRTDLGIQAQHAKLAESEERHRSLLDAITRSDIFLFVVDKEYRVRYMNEAMIKAFGDMTGKICYKDVSGYESPCAHCQLHEVLSNKNTVRYQATLADNRSFNMTGVPYVDADGTLCKLEVMQDTTEQKRVEHEKAILEKKLLRAKQIEAIGLLAGGVAHDLNNILSGIVGYPELMLHTLPKESALRPPLMAIQDSGKRAAAVVTDLLTVARGAASIREPHDLNALVQEYLNSPEFQKLTTLHPKVRHFQQLDASYSNILCSPVHIKKSLMNLVTNAAETIADKGTVSISTTNHHIDTAASAEYNLTEGDYVLLSVRDTGHGISEKDLDHIFEPFYTQKEMGKSGTGLGLTIVWNTIHDHDGKIMVESDEQGTCFTLYFPVSQVKAGEQNDNSATHKTTCRSEHILIVDDEPLLLDIAKQMLLLLGYKVDSVSSGELAVQFVKEKAVDLIVIDMLMEPGMNGRQTYEEIIALYPDQKAIITSGFSKSDDVKATLKLGAGGFIKKPYSIDQLSQAVNKALGGEKIKT